MTLYPPIERWLIPTAACEQTRNAVMPAGLCGRESGVLWLGQRGAESSITVVVKPVGPGVIESPWQWSVSPEVYAAVSAWARPRGLTLLAAVHSHLSRREPRMSRTDRTQGLKVPDALAVIVRAAGEERDPRRWGWFVYDTEDYRTLDQTGLAQRVTFTTADAEYAEVSAIGAA